MTNESQTAMQYTNSEFTTVYKLTQKRVNYTQRHAVDTIRQHKEQLLKCTTVMNL